MGLFTSSMSPAINRRSIFEDPDWDFPPFHKIALMRAEEEGKDTEIQEKIPSPSTEEGQGGIENRISYPFKGGEGKPYFLIQGGS